MLGQPFAALASRVARLDLLARNHDTKAHFHGRCDLGGGVEAGESLNDEGLDFVVERGHGLESV